jgi:hypothetical protein
MFEGGSVLACYPGENAAFILFFALKIPTRIRPATQSIG